MTNIRSAALAVIAAMTLMLLPLALGGQVPEPGARVRVTLSNGARHQGALQAIESDSARLTGSRGTLVAVPLADVDRLEVSLGRRRQFWKHLGMTAAGLALVSGALSASTYEPCDEDVLFGCLMSPESRSEAFLWGALVGGAAGVPAGIVVGAAVRRERWAAVEHQAIRPRQVSVRPIVGNGVGLAATLTFE